MKTLKTFLLAFALIFFSQFVNAQTQSTSFKVAGECGMCKKKIETAAKDAGASYALWDVASKSLKVKFASSTSSEAKIQQSIAAVGYDTPKYKATDEAYEKLHECCKYERTTQKVNCCDGASCTNDSCKTCCKEGKCTTGADCCKDGQCSKNAAPIATSKEPMSCCSKS